MTLVQSYIGSGGTNIGDYTLGLSQARWDNIKDDVKVLADRIILPGFSLGVKKQDEPGEYTPREAWEKFGDALMFQSQVKQLLEYGRKKAYETSGSKGFIDEDDLFKRVLGMEHKYYYMHGDTSTKMRQVMGKPNIGYSLVPGGPFGTGYNKIIQMPYFRIIWLPSIGVHTLRGGSQEKQKFKVRLQAS